MAKHVPIYCNDAKVGPDGRFYVGTQSRKRQGISEDIDGCLYSVDAKGRVKLLLEGLRLSNGFDWSMDEKRFYHTDSDTHIIREYGFDKATGDIAYTGREISVPGVDGFAMGCDDRLYVACWGRGHIAVVDTATMEVAERIPVPVKIPVSCGFFGEHMERLAIVTAAYGKETADPLAGQTFAVNPGTRGRAPWLFGEVSKL
jgi:sugar lactone lactonase YvrE